MQDSRVIISSAYDTVIRKSLMAQIVIGVLAALLLDGGVTAWIVGVAVLAFWLCAGLVILRRPYRPTKVDLVAIQWGFWPVLLIAAMWQIYA